MKDGIKINFSMIILSILMVLLICLSVIYVFGFAKSSVYDINASYVNKLRSSGSKEEYINLCNIDYVLPDKIALCSLNQDRICLNNKEKIAEIYSKIQVLYKDIFNPSNYVIEMVKEDGEQYYSLMLDTIGLFMEWTEPLPFDLIYFMSYPNEVNSDVPKQQVKKMYFYYQNNGYACILVTGNDNYIIYRVENKSNELNQFLVLNDSIKTNDMIEFEFGYSYKKKNDNVEKLSNDAIITENLELKSIVLSRQEQSDLISKLELFDAFNINLIKASQYTDEFEAISYLEEGVVFKIEKDGTITYSQDGSDGVTLEKIFGGMSNYNIYDYVGACLMKIDEAKLDFGEGHIYLKHISSHNGVVDIDFGIRYDNVDIIVDENQYVISFHFENETLKNVSITSVIVKSIGDYVSVGQNNKLILLLVTSDKVNLNPIYRVEGSYLTNAEWINAVVAKNEVTYDK